MGNKRDKKSSWISVAAGVAILLLSLAGSEEGPIVLFVLLVIVAIIAFIFGMKKFGSSKIAGQIPFGKITNLKTLFESAAWNKDIPQEDSFVSHKQEIAKFDENAQENNFIRDRERRLKQLEVFLKNGIIEKEEYLLLRKRYEKNK